MHSHLLEANLTVLTAPRIREIRRTLLPAIAATVALRSHRPYLRAVNQHTIHLAIT